MQEEFKYKRPPRSLRPGYFEAEDDDYEDSVQEKSLAQEELEKIESKYKSIVTENIQDTKEEEPKEEVITKEESTNEPLKEEVSAVRKSPIISSRIVYNKPSLPKSNLEIDENNPTPKQQPKPVKKSTKKTQAKTTKLTQDQELKEEINEIKEAASEAKEALDKIIEAQLNKLSEIFEKISKKVEFVINSLMLNLAKGFNKVLNSIFIPLTKTLIKLLDAFLKGFIIAFKNRKIKLSSNKENEKELSGDDKENIDEKNIEDSKSSTTTNWYNSFKELGIEFFTFRKEPLVSGNEPDIEQAFIQNILDDIRYCKKFVDKLPSPTEGPYAGKTMVEIFTDVTEEDIFKFFNYVKKFPDIFRDKNFKIAEAFATWVIKKSKDS